MVNHFWLFNGSMMQHIHRHYHRPGKETLGLSSCKLRSKRGEIPAAGMSPKATEGGGFSGFSYISRHCSVSQELQEVPSLGCHPPLPPQAPQCHWNLWLLRAHQTPGRFYLHPSSTIPWSRNTQHCCQEKHVVTLLLTLIPTFPSARILMEAST